jgi:hypothetical protein
MPELRAVLTATTTRILVGLMLVAPAIAQNRYQSEPPAAASGPALDASVGYTFLAMQVPDAGNVNLNGVDASTGIYFTRRWGAIADASYVRGSSLIGTQHESYVISALAGPVFYPFEWKETRFSVRALGGAGLVDSAVPVPGPTDYLHGWVARPSYAAGVGVEHSLPGPFALRVNGDYLRTAFVNPAGTVQLQNNLRVTASIVLRLRQGSVFSSR